jgi:hypothetical protein
MLKNVNLVVLTGNKDDDNDLEQADRPTGPGVEPSTVNAFVSALASSGRATVINSSHRSRPERTPWKTDADDSDDDPMIKLATELLKKETKAKEGIEARGVPPGKYWWEMRNVSGHGT